MCPENWLGQRGFIYSCHKGANTCTKNFKETRHDCFVEVIVICFKNFIVHTSFLHHVRMKLTDILQRSVASSSFVFARNV
jgi:hypothetical protein